MGLRGSGGAEEDDGGWGGNRWPRDETIALIKIRTDIDSAFREANLKGHLSIWEDISRKLGEAGYRRSAKKCKEKFGNVQKYHNRTKRTRPARQHGKSYKFFQHLEAICHNTTTATHMPMPVTTTALIADIFPLSAGFPTPISSFPTPPPPPHPPPPPQVTTSSVHTSFNDFPHNLTLPMPLPTTAGNSIDFGISSDTSISSFSHEIEDDDKEVDAESEGQPSNLAGSSRKRKRFSALSTRMMMECFEKVLKQVTQKQEEMQVKFLQIIDKGENDRMIRDEAWKRQKIASLNREEELIAQHRAGSAPRYAAIVSFLQTLTGQTIKFSESVITSPPPAPPSMQQIIMAVPEQRIPPRDSINSMSMEPASSRWPKTEILALINLRNEVEIKYQETSPKGPLWEEISAGMQRLGYKRNAKRCKEKWENINKYYKKVKESHKERPKDSKTCPYYHQLDAIYQRKVVGGAGQRLSLSENTNMEHSPVEAQFCVKNDGGVNVLSSSLFELENGVAAKEPEDTTTPGRQQQQQQGGASTNDWVSRQ